MNNILANKKSSRLGKINLNDEQGKCSIYSTKNIFNL